MADSLVLTGKKTVTKHTGTEMVRLDDKRGGNTWQLPRWWVTGGNGTVYVASTVFRVEAGGGTGYLAVASTSESTRMKIIHNGDFTFDFQYLNEVSRAALYDADMKLVEHYVFPKISGGKTMVVTPPGGAPRPASGAVTQTYTVTAAGGKYSLNGSEQPALTFSTGDIVLFDYTAAPEHPLAIYTDSNKSEEITQGISRQNNKVTWTVGVAGSYSYQCQVDADMGGDITVS